MKNPVRINEMAFRFLSRFGYINENNFLKVLLRFVTFDKILLALSSVANNSLKTDTYNISNSTDICLLKFSTKKRVSPLNFFPSIITISHNLEHKFTFYHLSQLLRKMWKLYCSVVIQK